MLRKQKHLVFSYLLF